MVRKRLVGAGIAWGVNGICLRNGITNDAGDAGTPACGTDNGLFTLLSIDVPDELIQSANMDELPDNWADEDAPQELADYGDASVIYRGARLLCVFPQPYRR